MVAGTLPTSAERLRVLVVEDDPISRAALLKILSWLNYDAHAAETVREAVDKLDAKPQCILLDLMLPDGSGLEVLREVRRRELPARVAIVTASCDLRLLAEVGKLQPDNCFYKPVETSRILRWL